jgi:hypothetical protein
VQCRTVDVTPLFSPHPTRAATQEDLPRLQAAMSLPNDALHTPAAGLFPEFEQIELLAGQQPDTPFDQLVSKLASGSRYDIQSLVVGPQMICLVPGWQLGFSKCCTGEPAAGHGAG